MQQSIAPAGQQPAGLPALWRPVITGLTVLYDEACSVCRACRHSMESQSQLVPVTFVAARSEEARRRFPDLDHAKTVDEITVVSDDGSVFRGDDAFILCLWAMRNTRHLAEEVANGRNPWVVRALLGATGLLRALSKPRCDEAASCHAPMAGSKQ